MVVTSANSSKCLDVATGLSVPPAAITKAVVPANYSGALVAVTPVSTVPRIYIYMIFYY